MPGSHPRECWQRSPRGRRSLGIAPAPLLVRSCEPVWGAHLLSGKLGLAVGVDGVRGRLLRDGQLVRVAVRGTRGGVDQFVDARRLCRRPCVCVFVSTKSQKLEWDTRNYAKRCGHYNFAAQATLIRTIR
jgi:hypothetical protein